MPGVVHQVVHDLGGDDLAAQRVRGDQVVQALAHGAGEVAEQVRLEVLVVEACRWPAAPRSARSWCTPAARRAPAGSGPGRPSGAPGSPARAAGTPGPGSAGRPRPAGACTARARAAVAGPGRRRRRARRSGRSCRRGRGRRSPRSSRPAARCAPRPRARRDLTAWSTRILMLTSWSEVSTPAELSIASVLIRPPLPDGPPCSAYSIRPSWVQPRLPPSPTTLTRSCAPLTRIASLALSPTSACDSPADFT